MRLNNLFHKNQMSPLFLVCSKLTMNFQQRFIVCFLTNKQYNPNDSLIKLNVEF